MMLNVTLDEVIQIKMIPIFKVISLYSETFLIYYVYWVLVHFYIYNNKAQYSEEHFVRALNSSNNKGCH